MSDTLESLKQRRNEIDDEISVLSDERVLLAKQIALLEANFRIGEHVEMYGKEFVISKIASRYDCTIYFGKKILKSGDYGKQEFELYGHLESIL